MEVSTKGMHSIFLMNIPRNFLNLNSRVFLEVDQVADQDASAIAAGFCQMQDKIICLFVDLANIHSAGQVDVLPFPCEQNPMLIHLLFQGDEFLLSQLQVDGDYNHQYLSIVHVVFQAKDILCHGNNHGGTQVICSLHFQRNLQQAQQHLQVPYYAPQQQQQPHVHFAPQPPPPPPAQQQQQQPPQQQQQQQPPQQQQQQQPPQQQLPQQQPQQQQQQQVPIVPQPPLPPQQQQQHVANGLYAAGIQRRTHATVRAHQQNPGGSNGP
jgi:hypothetical protein